MKAIAQPPDNIPDLSYDNLNITQGNTYYILSIEDDMYRVVNDMLDPVLYHSVYFDVLDYADVKNWIQEISDDGFYFYPKEFSQHSYFYQNLHEGENHSFIEIADIYIGYITQLLGRENIIEALFKNYLNARDNNSPFPYWQKEWLKHRFKVDKAIELRKFNKQDWHDILAN